MDDLKCMGIRVFTIFVWSLGVGTQFAKADLPKGFEGKNLELVERGQIVTEGGKDTSQEYSVTLRALIRRAKTVDYIRLITPTDEYHHINPDVVISSTKSDGDLIHGTYQMDVKVYYGHIPVTLYATVSRTVEQDANETRIIQSYIFDGFEEWLEPIVETTHIVTDSEHPEIGIYVSDQVDIHLKKPPINARMMKDELTLTFTKLLAGYKTKLDGEVVVIKK
jgi:hypothetical protein